MTDKNILLAIDTSDNTTGMAIISEDGILGVRNIVLNKGRDSVLSDMQKELFTECNLKLKELSGIAVSMGPGSFTGLRVGLAYAKGICFALDIPLFGIDSLEALAHSAGYSEKLIAPMIHAKGDEIYIASFRYINDKLKRITPGSLIDFRDALNLIKDEPLFIGSGYNRHKNDLKKVFADYSEIEVHAETTTVIQVAKLGYSAFLAGKSVNLLNFEPKYLQNFPRSS